MTNQKQSKAGKIIKEISAIGPMRKGSITMQTFSVKKKDGTKTQRGPYPLYTCKKNGRTVSKRIPKDQVEIYQKQIDRHRHFQELVQELAELGEQMADDELREGGEKKGS
jgi:hypothetical protein